jgi:catalase
LVGRTQSLAGRSIGVLVADGTDALALGALLEVAAREGATVRLIAASGGTVKLAGGTTARVDARLGAAPLLFDAVALLLSASGVAEFGSNPSALAFVHHAYGHLEALGADDGGRALLRKAGVEGGLGVIPLGPPAPFLAAAKSRS